jgi:hypothetical protein
MRQNELQMRDLRDYINQSSPPVSDENDPAATRRRLSDAGPIAYRLNAVPLGYLVYVVYGVIQGRVWVSLHYTLILILKSPPTPNIKILTKYVSSELQYPP